LIFQKETTILFSLRLINRQAGRYIGEIRLQFDFRGKTGPYCGWVHVDAESLKAHAESAGWACEIVHREESSEYLAQLTKKV